MCGFVGYLDPQQPSYDHQATIKAMADTIAHRGPDDESYFIDEAGGYAAGFRRLSIIDLEGGRQPMTNEDGMLVSVLNGEIYNYQALREELKAAGHTFKTHADSEVVLHGYEQWGTDLFDHLRGMFAFAIYNTRTREIFVARDFFGIKPLYWAWGRGSDAESPVDPGAPVFLFASEIKAILQHPAFEARLNERALESYLSFQYSPGPETFFQNCYKLTPGHWMRWMPGMAQPEMGRYWKPVFTEDDQPTLDNWVDGVEATMDDSIAAHKIADVEVGSFLSSGVDSSYVACRADVDKTFTVGFDNGEKYNECDYARELSELIDVKNFAKIITPEEFWGYFPRVQWHMDEPLADASAVALYFVAREAAKQLKVVLSGEGADEIFGGYNIYNEPLDATAYDKIPFFLRRVASVIASKLPAHRGLNFIVRRGKRLEDWFIGNANIFSVDERRKLLKHPAGAPTPAEVVALWYAEVADKDAVTKMQYVDLNAWMVGDILLKSDKMSMANSLELRPPFLDKEVMRLAGKIPAHMRVHDHVTKQPLRLAARRAMPEKWANKKKLGFPVPIRVWLTEERWVARIREAFNSPAAQCYFNTARLNKLLDDHLAGKADNSRKIWTVYTFLVWYDVYFGANEGAKPAVTL
ncbi:MAG: asparagine synthase (glutamine-hydrolyzing) [Coriobacteriia bacterium]|nr:asparagine synthase (glutamine-hydrolyzing) [Coriobacteriia bacterium]